MSDLEFLEEFAKLFDKRQDVRLYYTTNDDGVYLQIGDDEINLGFSGEQAAISAGNLLSYLRSKEQ